jgi:hypothetical protein
MMSFHLPLCFSDLLAFISQNLELHNRALARCISRFVNPHLQQGQAWTMALLTLLTHGLHCRLSVGGRFFAGRRAPKFECHVNKISLERDACYKFPPYLKMRKYLKIFWDGNSISMKLRQPSQSKLCGAALFFSLCKGQHHHVGRRKHPCIRIE